MKRFTKLLHPRDLQTVEMDNKCIKLNLLKQTHNILEKICESNETTVQSLLEEFIKFIVRNDRSSIKFLEEITQYKKHLHGRVAEVDADSIFRMICKESPANRGNQ